MFSDEFDRWQKLDAEVFALRRAFVTLASKRPDGAKSTETELRELAESFLMGEAADDENKRRAIQRCAEAILRLCTELTAGIGLEEGPRRGGQHAP